MVNKMVLAPGATWLRLTNVVIIVIVFIISLHAIPWQQKIVAFCHKNLKWNQNVWFTPLSERQASPTLHTRVPPGLNYLNK